MTIALGEFIALALFLAALVFGYSFGMRRRK